MINSIQLNRKVPVMGPEHYKTYSMAAPLRTHWRQATCEEYECAEFLNGFVMTINLASDLGKRQLHYLTHDDTRRYSMQRVSPDLIKLVYGPGNRCFSWGEHRIPIGRPPLLIVRGGDWRGNPRKQKRLHTSVENWVEDSATHLGKIAELVRRG